VEAFAEKQTISYMAYMVAGDQVYLDDAAQQVASAKAVQVELGKVVPAERQKSWPKLQP
jgi:hypothetical protein